MGLGRMLRIHFVRHWFNLADLACEEALDDSARLRRFVARCMQYACTMTEIKPASFPEDLERVVAIFREYVASPSVSLDFQDYEPEFASLPGKYAAPEGRLLLAWKGGTVVGCAALRKVDRNTCEMKRVFIRSTARGEGLGRRLVESILAEARKAGYSRICLDVLPEFTAAQAIYESLGFRPAPPVTFNPVPGTKFLGLDLPSSAA